jgi:hypothetical protein
MFHGRLRLDWTMFVPTWCPKQPSQLQVHTPENFAHVSFSKVRVVHMRRGKSHVLIEACVHRLMEKSVRNTGSLVFPMQTVNISTCFQSVSSERCGSRGRVMTIQTVREASRHSDV